MRLVFDIEEWRDVVGAEDRYEVSSKGRVRSKSYTKHGRNMHGPFSYVTTPKIMATQLNVSGYPVVSLRLPDGSDRTVTVHRLVAEAFLPNPHNLPQVNHKDSDRQNNSIENLEWCTAQENVQHSYDFGLNSNAGENHPRSVLNEEIVREIRRLYDSGERVVDIATNMGLKYHTVHKVALRENWRHVL